MAKRLCDTGIWQKEWYLKLSSKHKLLVKFLFDNCDCAGIYIPNFTLLSFYIGESIDEKDFEALNQVRRLENGNYFIEDFIKFQYRVEIHELNPKFSVHKGVLQQLKKNNITVVQPLANPCETLSEPLANPCETVAHTLQDKDKDKDKDKKEIIVQNLVNPDSFLNDDRKYFDIYKANCTNLIPLSYEKRNPKVRLRLEQFKKETNADLHVFESACRSANKLVHIGSHKIDFLSILNNYIGILGGKYCDSGGDIEEKQRATVLKLLELKEKRGKNSE